MTQESNSVLVELNIKMIPLCAMRIKREITQPFLFGEHVSPYNFLCRLDLSPLCIILLLVHHLYFYLLNG